MCAISAATNTLLNSGPDTLLFQLYTNSQSAPLRPHFPGSLNLRGTQVEVARALFSREGGVSLKHRVLHVSLKDMSLTMTPHQDVLEPLLYDKPSGPDHDKEHVQ